MKTVQPYIGISENTTGLVNFDWPVSLPTYDICKVRMQFETWIKTHKLVTKYGCNLNLTSDGQYKDNRIQAHWATWKSAIKNYRITS